MLRTSLSFDSSGHMIPYVNTAALPFVSFFNKDTVLGLILWFAASAITGKADNESLTALTDLSDSANDATGSGATYKSNAGQPSIQLDGSAGFLLDTNITAGPMTVFAVARAASVEDGAFGYQALFSSQKNAIFANAGSDIWEAYTSTDLPSDTDLNSVKIICAKFVSASDVSLYTNGGSAVTPGGGSTYQARSGTAIGQDPGGTQQMTGDIYEILVYDSALNDTDRATVRDYLNTKYAIY